MVFSSITTDPLVCGCIGDTKPPKRTFGVAGGGGIRPVHLDRDVRSRFGEVRRACDRADRVEFVDDRVGRGLQVLGVRGGDADLDVVGRTEPFAAVSVTSPIPSRSSTDSRTRPAGLPLNGVVGGHGIGDRAD